MPIQLGYPSQFVSLDNTTPTLFFKFLLRHQELILRFSEILRDIGFRIVPARIVVSKEAADAIAQAAANLGLPTPPVSVVDTPETRAAAAATRPRAAGLTARVEFGRWYGDAPASRTPPYPWCRGGRGGRAQS